MNFQLALRRAGEANMKKNIQWIYGSVVITLLMLVTQSNAIAQSGVAIKGQVADERGSFIKDAEVRLNARTGFTVNTKTDSTGA